MVHWELHTVEHQTIVALVDPHLLKGGQEDLDLDQGLAQFLVVQVDQGLVVVHQTIFIPINLTVLEEVPLVDLVCQTPLQIVGLPTLVNSPEVTHLVGQGLLDLHLFLALDLHSLPLALQVVLQVV